VEKRLSRKSGLFREIVLTQVTKAKIAPFPVFDIGQNLKEQPLSSCKT
jgi:hypothetical protein